MRSKICLLHGRSPDNRIDMNAWVCNSIICLFYRTNLIPKITNGNPVPSVKSKVVDSDNLAWDYLIPIISPFPVHWPPLGIGAALWPALRSYMRTLVDTAMTMKEGRVERKGTQEDHSGCRRIPKRQLPSFCQRLRPTAEGRKIQVFLLFHDVVSFICEIK